MGFFIYVLIILIASVFLTFLSYVKHISFYKQFKHNIGIVCIYTYTFNKINSIFIAILLAFIFTNIYNFFYQKLEN